MKDSKDSIDEKNKEFAEIIFFKNGSAVLGNAVFLFISFFGE
jgi:hypothetical protein